MISRHARKTAHRHLGVVMAAILLPAGAVVAQENAGLNAAAQRTADFEEPSFRIIPEPSLNFYGSPGLIDMPTAEMMPDGQFATTVSYFGGQGRYTLTFQALPWLSASFRYNSIRNWNLGGFPTYYDRGFDVRFRLLKERRNLPEITLGLQDFAGTGIYAAEYIVATKNFETPPLGTSRLPGRLKVTAGVGWGRLGSYNSIASYGTRPPFDPSNTGGQLSYDQWFRGPFALFGGLEWQANEQWAFKLEYSSDDYVTETQTTSVFDKKSPVNFGVEYQWTRTTRLGAYYMYGSEIGVSAQFQLNPSRPITPMRVSAPQPIQPRPSRAEAPEVWTLAWTESASAPSALQQNIAALLEPDGLILQSLALEPYAAEVRFRNTRYNTYPIAVGRVARAMARALPGSIETFRIVPVERGMALSAVTIRRSDLEALEFAPDNNDAILSVAGITNAGAPSATAQVNENLYPDFSWAIAPYFSPAYFDPTQPFLIDVGVEASATYKPAPGWVISGALRQRIAGNLENGRTSPSLLPPVRTDQALYAQYSTTINQLYVARYWKPDDDLYARVSAGYFEYGYGGLSTELLWKPVNSQLGLGVEVNYAMKRDYDQMLGFQDYSIVTGHASAYMDFDNGIYGQVDVGRYLAGDYGVTVSVDRVFANGWSVGGFFTQTTASSTEFGEGSFDKGIRFSIPLSFFTGQPSRKSQGTTIRPIQRDGGARMHVPGRLYDQVRGAHRKAMDDQWAGFWE
ncbi:YjbH domain-containing protein [Lutimaribacter marinistellae]|uniref:YjbH domain-containing protein n=1 Tax=Lutimaribacter marinistellae TaxID=1820329 RepID=A0ABV7TBD2_9RHOB